MVFLLFLVKLDLIFLLLDYVEKLHEIKLCENKYELNYLNYLLMNNKYKYTLVLFFIIFIPVEGDSDFICESSTYSF